MSINKLSHLKDWEKIYLEVTREMNRDDDEGSLYFDHPCCWSIWVNDDDIFYFPDELKQLANDGMPKQGEMIEVRDKESSGWYTKRFISFYYGKVVVGENKGDWAMMWDEWRPLLKKTELTLAEVEEKLGIEKGSLIIK